MRLSGNRYDEIEAIVVDFFKTININKFPLDCFEICDQRGIVLIPYSELSEKEKAALNTASEDGSCVLVELQKDIFAWAIYYNDKMPKQRIRFTIMHELGHIILDHSEHSDLAESEANYFAKYALAPPPLIRQFPIEDYIELARVFDLSTKCAFWSMQKYNKWLMYHSKHQSKHEILLVSLFQPLLGA